MFLEFEQATSLIVARATQLVNQLVNNRGHENPPFSPEEFAHLKGIKEIVKTDLGTVSAILLKFHDGDVIKVNSNHYPGRQNFSCAHEIGHILFNELQLEQCMTNIEYRTHNSPAFMGSRPNAVERLCDVAATELLMPRDIYKKHLLNFGSSINSVRQLADLFRVSVHTAAIRFSEISPEPCIAFFWRRQKNKPNSLQLARPTVKVFQKNIYTIVHQRVTSSSVISVPSRIRLIIVASP